MPTRRAFVCSSAVLGAGALLPAVGADGEDLASLARMPDLAPSLTQEEVSKAWQPWLKEVKLAREAKQRPQWAELYQGDYLKMCRQFSTALPQARKITLYSLHPAEHWNVSGALERMPRFHDFPILGSLTLSDPDVAQRWSGFLRDQIVPVEGNFCDFEPRHGFRLNTDDREVDLLMCFKCSALSVHGMDRPTMGFFRPVFSRAVKGLANSLFDKNKVERDKPKSETDKTR